MSDAPADMPRPLSKGMINPRKVKLASFVIISICIIACTVISILGVWDFTRNDTVWRAFATFVIVALSAWFFAIVNERFGD
jgi:hypothetical protein